MRGIYFTTMCNIEDPNDNIDPGIREKILQQYRLFQSAGISMHFYYAHRASRYYRYVNRMPLFRDKYDLPESVIQESDFIYLRKPSTINMGFIDFLKRIRSINPGMKILLEIPTYPYDDEIQGLIRVTLKWKDQYARKKLKDYVDVILTYSDDQSIFGVKAINISNGVDVVRLSSAVKKYPHPNDEKIRLMACAKFNLWHGYDRAIEGLHQYLQKPDANRNVEIEMVGDGASTESYRQLVEKYSLQEYVRFYGKLQGEDLVKVYSICDIGLDSMGRHRSGVYYNSSLKGKEYCAYGLVIVSGVKTELDGADDFAYYYRIPADDTPLDFDAVLDFYKKSAGEDREKMREIIMQYALNHFSMEVVFQPVIDYIFADERA